MLKTHGKTSKLPKRRNPDESAEDGKPGFSLVFFHGRVGLLGRMIFSLEFKIDRYR